MHSFSSYFSNLIYTTLTYSTPSILCYISRWYIFKHSLFCLRSLKSGMADKQAPLNGAYYGPSIPPPQRSYYRPGRSSGCCCCGCLFNCLFGLICKLIVTAVVIVGLACLIFWLIFRPSKVKFHVADASLTQFNLTANNTLHYNLAVNITVRNPNKKIGIYYDRIEARALFEDARFGSQFLTNFYQGHKNTTVLHALFEGQQLVVLDSDEVSKFNAQKTSGLFDIDVKLYLRIRFKLGPFKTGRFKPKVKCDVKLPLASDGTLLSGDFETKKCGVDYWSSWSSAPFLRLWIFFSFFFIDYFLHHYSFVFVIIVLCILFV